jgi:hypothetical protein
MRLKIRSLAISSCFVLISFISGLAQDQTVPGAGNQHAINLSSKSPLVQSAYRFLISQAGRINDSRLRKETLDAITNAIPVFSTVPESRMLTKIASCKV